MPTNLYGENDNFHPSNSHVIPALLRRFHEAKLEGLPQVVVWVAGHRCASFCMLMIWLLHLFMSWSLIKSTLAEQTQPMLSHINVALALIVLLKS